MTATAHSTSPVFILRALIRCRSVTPDESGCFSLLDTLLAPLGFHCERIKFRAPNTPAVENFYAKRAQPQTAAQGKQSQARHLLFAGHSDVVPAGDEKAWRLPPFAAEQAGGLLFGRGAVDMKGGIACFIAALARLAQAGKLPNGAISLLLTGDEEGPAINGTAKTLQWAADKGEKWDAALVGEPSSAEILGDMIKIGRRGSLSAVLRLRGKQGHVAYPHRADNPLSALPALLQALLAPPLDSGNARFQPSNLELTSIDTGNAAGNIIPAQAEARFNIRFNDCWTVESLKAELQARLQIAAQQAAAARADKTPPAYDLEFAANPSAAFITENQALLQGLAAAIQAVAGRAPQLSTGGGTSDARFIKNYCPVAEFGLVGQTMHQIDECVSLDDLEKLTQIYQHFIENFFTAA